MAVMDARTRNQHPTRAPQECISRLRVLMAVARRDSSGLHLPAGSTALEVIR
jgi:hypothetical protein